MTDFYDNTSIVEKLIPKIDAKVRGSKVLEPFLMVLGVPEDHDHEIPIGPYFRDAETKDTVLLLIQALFENKAVSAIVMVSECWTAEIKTDEEMKAFKASDRAVKDLDIRKEAVLVYVYTRDMSDRLFHLPIKPGRMGVEPDQGAFSSQQASGRFVRKSPDDN